MIKAPMVSSKGASIPAIGLGTWPLVDDGCIEAVATALKTGYRHIDTAFRYGNEKAVGQGLKAGGVARGEIWVTTKVWWDAIAEGDLQRSAETSLKLLDLDYVDLLLIHWPNPAIPLAQSIAALNDAKRRGLARHIGVSNFPTAHLDQAMALTKEPIVVNQCEYHPYLDQSKVLAACRRHGIAFTSYCPLGRASAGGLLDDPLVGSIAARLSRTPGQIVLRWHVQQKGVVAVPKSGNAARIAQNLAVFDFELTGADMRALSALARPDGRVVKLDWAPKWD